MSRLSLREVQEVARLAADSGAKVRGAGPTVHSVADALGLPPTEVELLLDQARQGRSPLRDFKIVAGIAALVVAFLLGFGTTSLVGRHTAQGTVSASTNAGGSSGASFVPHQSGAEGGVIQNIPDGAPIASNEPPSQLSAQGAPLESKTLGGDVRNSVDKARRLSAPHVAQQGDGGGQVTFAAANAR